VVITYNDKEITWGNCGNNCDLDDFEDYLDGVIYDPGEVEDKCDD